jgi:hypothetical protein
MPTTLVTFKVRGDTAAQMALANPVLKAWEIAAEGDTQRLKIGDGVTPWNSLPYAEREGTTKISAAVANSTTSYASVTGLSFPVAANKVYRFRFFILFTSAAPTTGSRFSISGPAAMMGYRSLYSSGTNTETVNSGLFAYDRPIAANAASNSSLSVAIIEGSISPSAAGVVIARFASGVAGSAITVQANSYVQFAEI